MATPSEVINQSSSAISGALTLDYILASAAPYVFSDFNYKITNHVFPEISPGSEFPNSGVGFLRALNTALENSCRGSIMRVYLPKLIFLLLITCT